MTRWGALLVALSTLSCAGKPSRDVRATIDALSRRPPAGLPGDTAAGIRLGEPLVDVKLACRRAQRTWTDGNGYSSCSGPIDGTLARWHNEVRVAACDGTVCAMVFDVAANGDQIERVGASLIKRLESRAGRPMSDTRIPAACAHSLFSCVRSGRLAIELTWEVAPRRWESVLLQRETDRVHLHVAFFNRQFLDHAKKSGEEAAHAVDGLFPTRMK